MFNYRLTRQRIFKHNYGALLFNILFIKDSIKTHWLQGDSVFFLAQGKVQSQAIFLPFFPRRGCWFRLCSWCFPSNFLIECQVIQVNVGRLVDSAMTIPHPLGHPLFPAFPCPFLPFQQFPSFFGRARALSYFFHCQHPDICIYGHPREQKGRWAMAMDCGIRTTGTPVWAACKSNFIFYEVPHRLRPNRPAPPPNLTPFISPV